MLRPELEPNLSFVENIFLEVVAAISLFDIGFDDHDKQKMQEAVSQINFLTNGTISEEDLYEYWAAEDIKSLAFRLSLPIPDSVGDLSRNELLEIIARIRADGINGVSEKLVQMGLLFYDLKSEFYIPLLERHYSHPAIYSLFGTTLTDEEIADAIVSHKAIQL